MAKKAAARKSAAKRSAKQKGSAKKTMRKAGGTRTAVPPRKQGVDFKPLHDAMDAAIAELQKYKKSLQRDKVLLELKLMRKFEPCPNSGMFLELELLRLPRK